MYVMLPIVKIICQNVHFAQGSSLCVEITELALVPETVSLHYKSGYIRGVSSILVLLYCFWYLSSCK